MYNKVHGDRFGSYYRIQQGGTDPAKRHVNAYWTTSASVISDNSRGLEPWFSWDLAGVAQADDYYIPGAMEAIKLATNDIITQQRGDIDQALIMADIAQAKGTAQVAVARAKQMLHVARALKKRDVTVIKKYFERDRVDRLSDVPSAWLEVQFVAKPLIGTANAVCNQVSNPSISRRVAYRSKEYPVKNVVEGPNGPYLAANLQYFAYMQGSVSAENPNADFINKMGVADLIQTTYDIIPWSWAVDYFSNVGDVLGNLNPKYDRFIYDNFSWGIRRTGTVSESFTIWQREPYETIWRSAKVDTFNRYGGRPTSVSFDLDFDLNIGQFSNLMSAIGLTLKGKFS
uniref:Maturation/attachment protein n=1 Tax=Marine phage AC TaxID=1414768 RepID=A0A068EM85_9VIRU|nr:maturation/attachment protein [Marine phage AC]